MPPARTRIPRRTSRFSDGARRSDHLRPRATPRADFLCSRRSDAAARIASVCAPPRRQSRTRGRPRARAVCAAQRACALSHAQRGGMALDRCRLPRPPCLRREAQPPSPPANDRPPHPTRYERRARPPSPSPYAWQGGHAATCWANRQPLPRRVATAKTLRSASPIEGLDESGGGLRRGRNATSNAPWPGMPVCGWRSGPTTNSACAENCGGASSPGRGDGRIDARHCGVVVRDKCRRRTVHPSHRRTGAEESGGRARLLTMGPARPRHLRRQFRS